MNYSMQQIAQIVAIILVVCEAVKRAGLAGKYIPFLAVVLGLICSFYLGNGVDTLTIASGVLVGFATSGGYGAFKGLTK
jgi:hypothetical protein